MYLSVIVPFYNAEKYISRQLNLLSNEIYSEEWEIILVDNLSTDSSRSIAYEYISKIKNLKIVDAKNKKGSSYARNVGVKSSRGDVLVFCDADDEIEKNYISILGEALKKKSFVASKIDLVKLNPFWGQLALRSSQHDSLPKLPYFPHCLYAGSGTFGITREAFNKIGGFDENVLLLEDAEFCIRAHLNGVEIIFVPDAVMHYRLGSSYRSIYSQRRSWARYRVLLASMHPNTEDNEAWQKCLMKYLFGFRHSIRRVLTTSTREERVCFVSELGKLIGTFEGCLKYRNFPR